MMSDNLEIKDGYDEVEQTKVRSIKMHDISFKNTLNFWNKWRQKRLINKLEKEKNALLTKGYNINSPESLMKAEKNIEKKTSVIARLEDKIRFLDGDYASEDYVKSRAIKLKEKMMANLSFNSSNAYSVGLDKADLIFEEDNNQVVDENVNEESVENNEDSASVEKTDDVFDRIILENQEKMAKEVQNFLDEKENDNKDEIEVVPTDIERQQIKDAIDEMFNNVEIDRKDETMNEVNNSSEEDEDIVTVIDSEIDKKNEENINSSEITDVVDEAMKDVEAVDISKDEEEISYDDIKNCLDEVFGNVKVSRNGTAAKIDKFDENGQIKENEAEVSENTNEEEKKYDYKPMTDEEIARARENIEYDKYEEIYRKENEMRKEKNSSETNTENSILNIPDIKFDDIFIPANKNDLVRDYPMVVPERETSEVYVKEEENVVEDIPEYTVEEEGLHFDYSTATAEEVNKGIDYASSLSEFDQLRKRAQELKEKQRKSKEDREAAEKAAEEAAKRAQAVKEAAAAAQKDYEKRLEKLRLYTEALAEDCSFNENKTRAAEDDAKSNEKFAQEQEAKANNMKEMIEEIDMIITAEATNVRRGK